MSEAIKQREFRTLLARAQGGSQEAARELYETYAKYVLQCVRHRMWRRLRTKFDSQDFAQSVWKSFFDGEASLPDFQTPDELIAYLQAIAKTKVHEESRRRLAYKRQVSLEEQIDTRSEPVGPHPATRLPTPSAVAIFRERYERVIGQHLQQERTIAELRLKGMTFQEIGEQLGMHESTVRKVMRQLKRKSSRLPEKRA